MAKSTRSLQDLVGQVFREHRRTDHVALVALQKHWAELVGSGLAERSWPTRLQQGVLWITAPDSSWAYQLQFLKQDFLGGIRTGMPDVSVSDVRFKVGALPAKASAPAGAPPAPAAGRAPVSPPAARSEPHPEAQPSGPAGLLDRAAAAIGDATLRDAFHRAMTKQARRNRDRSQPR